MRPESENPKGNERASLKFSERVKSKGNWMQSSQSPVISEVSAQGTVIQWERWGRGAAGYCGWVMWDTVADSNSLIPWGDIGSCWRVLSREIAYPDFLFTMHPAVNSRLVSQHNHNLANLSTVSRDAYPSFLPKWPELISETSALQWPPRFWEQFLPHPLAHRKNFGPQISFSDSHLTI